MFILACYDFLLSLEGILLNSKAKAISYQSRKIVKGFAALCKLLDVGQLDVGQRMIPKIKKPPYGGFFITKLDY
jgi:hypothetical protein